MIQRLYKALGGGRYWRVNRPPIPKIDLSRSERKLAQLATAVAKTEHLASLNVVECGVGVGRSLLHLLHLTGSNTKIYAFDTFSGFPEGGRLDSPSFDPTLDAYRVYENFSVSYVRNQLLQWSSEGETARIEFIPGLIPDSLSKFPDGETVRLLHLDLDLHVPYLASLQFFWDKLESGGLVLFDEYDQGEDLVKWPGAKLAIDHFCQEHDLEVEKMWSGFSYIKKP